MKRRTGRRLVRSIKGMAVAGSVLYLAVGACGLVNQKAYAEDATVTLETMEAHITIPEAKKKFSNEEAYLLAKIAMAEAESEDLEGKALVIRVVLNRTKNDGFPNDIYNVLHQKNQFSPLKTGGRWYATEPDKECWEAVTLVENGWDESMGALYFESGSKSGWHKRNLEFLFQHGSHNFYR